MDIINSIIEEVLKWIAPKILECLSYQKNFNDYVQKFEEEKGKLESRQKDIKNKLEAQLLQPGKIARNEVKGWLKKAEKIIGENGEDLINQGRCFSRSCRAKDLNDRSQKLKKICDEGEPYTKTDECLVVDDLSGKGSTMSTQELRGRDAIKAKILEYLVGDKFTRIGVCGIGGVGKTAIVKHVHDELLNKEKFNKVIFVVVSKQLDIIKLQRDIASRLKLSLREDEDEIMRAAELSERLRKGSYLLILDDVWQSFALEDVGIPDLVGDNGCKLVLTTRFRDVARRMDCKVVDVEPLPKDEALQLFLSKVGNDILSNAEGRSTLKQIVEECGGLPLAIITIASNMKGISNPYLWENTLHELRERKRTVAGTRIVGATKNDDAFEILKFSYDRLKDQKMQYCFLYCAMYPEDYEIPKNELIEYWIEEGLIDDKMKTRHEMNCKGHDILNKLEDIYLLECVKTLDSSVIEDEGEEAVKMHDLLRVMALDIVSKSPRFMVKAGKNMRELPDMEEWTRDVEKVSLMRNSIEEIRNDLSSPNCQMLTTLLLSYNNLSTIPDSFFGKMKRLKILDLSHNSGMKSLPTSISYLEDLTTLLLNCCESITEVPSLSKCKALIKLDLHKTGIEEVPEGMEMLVKLKYLDLSLTKIRQLPEGTLSKLLCLQRLSLIISGIAVKAEELAMLKKLESFDGLLRGWDEMSICIQLMQNRRNWLRDYRIQVGEVHESLQSACAIVNSQSLEFVFSLWFNPLKTLHTLVLFALGNLRSLFEEEALALSSYTFPLKTIGIVMCPKLKKLFWPRLLLGPLQKLEYIVVKDCEELEEIIASEPTEEARVELPLPKLKIFGLANLLKLKSICGKTRVLVCDSLEEFGIKDCKSLKRVPLYLPQLDKGQSSHPPLREIHVCPRELWESLEWDYPNAKDMLFRFCDFSGSWF
ncbi:hypothetical protein SLEP1_g15332 [Rubroshorea leprosula]|uniref:AAA+ ATPase domain-containing protein n=1 Tax=Rubroshorea leprosula TaxID=152421 RepID=A0AAV5IWG9_9ROSI|nr:hypothetical protein SLEP1_g15332 [Rubroshorea leprosula]